MAENLLISDPELVEVFQRVPPVGHRPICSSSQYRVTFHHPAYESTRLFEIPAFDGESGGIHHGTALLLCGIIADCAWDGWMSENKSGERLDLSFDAVLKSSDYYFHVPPPASQSTRDGCSVPYKWPIVLKFEHWSFPHLNPPPRWGFSGSSNMPSFVSNPSVSSMSQAIRDRDVTCRLSGYEDGIERAHLCPRSAIEWFNNQEMDRYNINQSLSGASSVDDLANAVALREDIHTAFDKGTFVFTRKRNAWVSHFLAPTRDLGPQYHNFVVEMPVVVSEAFILTKIARAVLLRLPNFLTRGEKRLVKLRKDCNNIEIVELDGKALQRVFGLSDRGRSNSPRKRQRDADPPSDFVIGESLKRPCLYASRHEEIPEIPALSASRSGSEGSDTQTSENTKTKDSHIEHLRKQALREQRGLHRSLACCDYDAAEVAVRDAWHGPKQFGGGHICLKCLGAEIQDAGAP
jgi:HNH endonuclease